MASSTGSLARLLDPGFRFVFFKFLREHDMEYNACFHVLDSERAYEEDIVYAGLGAVPEKPEGTNVIYDDPIQGNTIRYTHLTYGLAFRVTEEMYEDDLYGVVNKVVQALARSARHTLETISWDTLNFAFDTSRVGQDGLPLCSTAHVSLGGGTESNRPATDGDLDVTNLQAAIDSFERTNDHRGLPVALVARKLVIPPELKWKARVLLESGGEPGTADNDMNALQEESLVYFVSHYLTSTSAWWLLAGEEDHDLRFYKRRGVRFRSADDFDSGDSKHKVDFRCSAGFTNWYGTFGTSGA